MSLRKIKMKIEKDYTKLPNKYIFDSNISHAEFRVLAAIMSFGYGNNPSFPSQNRLSDRLGISTRTIRAHTASLKEKGFLKFKRRGFNKSNIYNFPQSGNTTSSREHKSHPTRKVVKYPPIKEGRVPHNNTINKTTNNSYKEEREGMESLRDTLKRKGIVS